MNYNIKFFFTVSLSILLFSCEAPIEINVLVLNKHTNEPLDSVYVKVMSGKENDFGERESGYTDIKGKYEAFMLVGCSNGCSDVKIIYNKKNFQMVETINNYQDTLFMVPL